MTRPRGRGGRGRGSRNTSVSTSLVSPSYRASRCRFSSPSSSLLVGPRGAHPIVPTVGGAGHLRRFAKNWELFCPDLLGGGGGVGRLPNRIHLSTTYHGRRKGYAHSSRSDPAGGARTGVAVTPTERSSNQNDRSRGTSLPVILLSSAEKGQLLAADPKSQTTECRSRSAATISHGNVVGHYSFSSEGNVGGVHRFEGCLSSHPNRPNTPALPRLQIPRGVVQVHVSPVRSVHVATCLHTGGRGSRSRATKARSGVVRLHRRLAHSRELRESNVRQSVGETITLLQSLGWVINWEKSHPTPSQSLIYLGARVDLVQGKMFPSQERVHSLYEALLSVEAETVSSAKRWLRVLGLLASLVDVVPLCRLHMRPLQFHLLTFFRPAERDLTVPIPLSESVRPHLRWWRQDRNLFEGIPFGVWRPQLTVTTDASLSGWGAFCEARTLSGVWTAEEAKLHINLLELEAVVRAVKSLADIAEGSCLTVFSDNTTTVAYINRQGGTRSPNLCLKAWFLLLWCRSHDIQLRASHIAGKDNTLADALSRGRVSQGEWELAPQWADWLFKWLGRPLVDLFATAVNAKLPTFCARSFHPQAWAVDALSFSWDSLDSYAFPPFCLIHRVLLKIRASNTRVLLIAPLWPRRPWFPILLHLLVDFPVVFPARLDLLSQDKGRVLHPRIQDLHLTAWRLSGCPSEHRDFLQTLPPWRPGPGDQPLTELMNLQHVLLPHITTIAPLIYRELASGINL